MKHVLEQWQPMLWIVGHTLVIYFFLILLLRTVGRRNLGQLTVVDLVVVVVMGSAVETAMVNADVTLKAGIVCAITLLLANRTLAFLVSRSRRMRHLVVGSPVLLVHNGHFIDEHLKRVGLTHENVLEAIRERETGAIEDVKFAVLEVDGTINVVPQSAETHRTFKDVRTIRMHGGKSGTPPAPEAPAGQGVSRDRK